MQKRHFILERRRTAVNVLRFGSKTGLDQTNGHKTAIIREGRLSNDERKVLPVFCLRFLGVLVP
jgi:hypothetical protein